MVNVPGGIHTYRSPSFGFTLVSRARELKGTVSALDGPAASARASTRGEAFSTRAPVAGSSFLCSTGCGGGAVARRRLSTLAFCSWTPCGVFSVKERATKKPIPNNARAATATAYPIRHLRDDSRLPRTVVAHSSYSRGRACRRARAAPRRLARRFPAPAARARPATP